MAYTINRRKTGGYYENKASEYLEKNGYEILEKNYRVRSGEIDLIAREGKYLCFVEVKYRRNEHMGASLEAVDYRKQQQIIRTALCYIRTHHLPEDTPCRFDVIGIDREEITLVRNAFMM